MKQENTNQNDVDTALRSTMTTTKRQYLSLVIRWSNLNILPTRQNAKGHNSFGNQFGIFL